MPPSTVRLESDTLIDISHESLIRGWQRLRGWVDDEAQSARRYIRLADTAELFPEGYLRDPELQITLNWREKQKPTKGWAMRYHSGFDKAIEYLERSEARRQQERADAELQAQRELLAAQSLAAERQKRVNQLVFGIVVLLLLLGGMLATTVFAVRQKRMADNAVIEVARQRDIAEASTIEATKQKRIAEDALKDARYDRDRAQAAEKEAATQRDVAQQERANAERERAAALVAKAEAVKQKGVAEQQTELAKVALSEETKSAEAARHAEAAAQEAERRAKEARDEAVKNLETIREIDRSAPYFRGIVRDPSQPIYDTWFVGGADVVTQGSDGSAHLWDYLVGVTDLANQPYLANRITTPVLYSRSGKIVLLTNHENYPGTVIWDLAERKELARGSWERVHPLDTIISPNDRFILRISQKQSVLQTAGDFLYEFYDTATGKLVTYRTGPNTSTFPRPIFSPDSNFALIVYGSTAHVWELDKDISADIAGHSDEITSVAFSPDSKLVVTASKDGTARILKLPTGELVQTLAGHDGPVTTAKFSDDGKYIVTTSKKLGYVWKQGSADWKGVTADSPVILKGHADDITKAVFSHDTKWVATIGLDRTAQLWDLSSRSTEGSNPFAPRAYAENVAIFRGHVKPLTSVDFSSDSKYLLTGSEDRTARVWDLSSLGAFAIETVNLNASPAQYAGSCPAQIKFTAAITVKGRSGTVKYKFVRSDGTSSLPQELVFDGPGTKEVSDTHDTIAITVLGVTPEVNGWEEIQVAEPSAFTSSRANFTVKCSASEFAGGKITDAQLQTIMPNSTAESRAAYLPSLQKAFEQYGINTPLQRAAFLAEVAVLTVDLKYLTQAGTDDALERLQGMRKDLGNFDPGDGARYRGRGAFMITGKAFYRAYGEQLGVDLINAPERLASPELAFRSAGLFWQKNALNTVAYQSDIAAVDRRIRGPNQRDLPALQSYFERAKSVLTVGQ